MRQRSANPYHFAILTTIYTLILYVVNDIVALRLSITHAIAVGRDPFAGSMLYYLLGGDITVLVLTAAFTLGFTAWFQERRRSAGLPHYGAIVIAAVHLLLVVVWQFLAASLFQAVRMFLIERQLIPLLLVMNVITVMVVPVLFVWLSVWIVFAALGNRASSIPGPTSASSVSSATPISSAPPAARTMPGLPASRGFALALVSLFAWAWFAALISQAAPFAMAYMTTMMGNAYAAPGPMALAPYMSTIFLVIPIFIGARLGLPAIVSPLRPMRQWGTATLAVLLCIVLQCVLAFIAVFVGMTIVHHFDPGVIFSAVLTLLWIVIATPLCRWLIARRSIAYRRL